MNKLQVSFKNTYHNTYSFLTTDNSITRRDLLLVPSPVAEKGLAIVHVHKIEENTNDLNHVKVISKVRAEGLATDLYSDWLIGSFTTYATNERIYCLKDKRKNHIVKYLSKVLDLDFEEYITIYNMVAYDNDGEYTYYKPRAYKLTKSRKQSNDCFIVDMLSHKVYINVEELQLNDKVSFVNYLNEMEIDVDKEKSQILKNNLKSTYDIDETDDDTFSAPIFAKNIINNILNNDDVHTYRHHGYRGRGGLDDYIFNYKYYDLEKNCDLNADELIKKYNIFNKDELATVKDLDIYETFIDTQTIEPLILVPLSEKEAAKFNTNLPLEGRLMSAGKFQYSYFKEYCCVGYDEDGDETFKITKVFCFKIEDDEDE